MHERELLERDLLAVGVARDVHAAVRARDQHALDDVAARVAIAAPQASQRARGQASPQPGQNVAARRGVAKQRLEARLVGDGRAQLVIGGERGFERSGCRRSSPIT